MPFFFSSYDGVYALSEQRVGGSGSLDLPKVVALELGLEEGSLTGTWNYSHSLQIICNNAFKKHRTKEKASVMVGDHEVYEAWYKVSEIGYFITP